MMTSFIVTERGAAGGTKPRFEHDFEIATHASPSEDELAYLGMVNLVLDRIAADVAVDAKASFHGSIRSARNAWRSDFIKRMRADADAFAAGTIDARQAKENAEKILGDYIGGIPDVKLDVASSPTFAQQLVLTISGGAPEAAELAYFSQLQEFLDTLSKEDAEDVATGYDAAALKIRRDQRTAASRELKNDFNNWQNGLGSDVAASNVCFISGGYRALRLSLGRPLFFVDVVKEAAGSPARADLVIRVEPDLPGAAGVPSIDQQNLFVQITNANTVIDAVCRQIEAKEREKTRAVNLRNEYVDKLAGIARVGLQGPHNALAVLALANLKAEFVAREAARIFNRYLWRLGEWAIGSAILFLLVYLFVRSGGCIEKDTCAPCKGVCVSWWDQHKTFLLVCVGASLGTWASFSVRQVNLTFEQLIAPEENVADPPLRIIFVVILALAASLLFWNDAINVKIGNLNTAPDIFKTNGTVALLIGFFCGLSERALALAISGRASSFVGGIAGSR